MCSFLRSYNMSSDADGIHHPMPDSSCAMKGPAMTFLTAFVTVFLAELGDKTQLATLALAAGGHSRWLLFLGAALALVTSSGLTVLVGTELGHVVPAVWLRRGAGVLMIALGALYVLQPA